MIFVVSLISAFLAGSTGIWLLISATLKRSKDKEETGHGPSKYKKEFKWGVRLIAISLVAGIVTYFSYMFVIASIF